MTPAPTVTVQDTTSLAGLVWLVIATHHCAFCVLGKTRELAHQHKVNIIYLWGN